MKKILLIDNSTVILNVLSDLFLDNTQFKIYFAKSHKEAENLIKKEEFFIAISNIVLPDALNGEIIKLLSTHDIPTIILSSSIDEDVIKIARENLVVDYVSKDSVYELEYIFKLIELLVFIEGIEVLVIDDSFAAVNKIKCLLESLLLKVHTAKNGQDALSLLNENKKISLIISDHYMDNVDGLEFVKRLRKNENYAKTPVIIMTTGTSNSLKIDFYKNSVTDFLIKPILEEELKAKVINIFSNKKYISDIKRFNKIIDENVITSSADLNGNIKYVSKAFCKTSGYSEDELIGKNHRILRHPDMPASIFEELWSTIILGKKWQGEIKNLRKDGSSYWIKIIIEPEYDNQGNIIGFTSLRQDVSDKKRIYELSITDGLTSLYNRRYFNEVSSKILKNNIRDNKTFGFILLDIDHFKKINDTYGHQVGDKVLISVSKVLEKIFKRKSDIVFRLGGEEFGIIVTTKTKDDVILLAEKTRQAVEDLDIEHNLSESYLNITASLGLTILDQNTDSKDLDMEAIYKMSDYYLYKAKNLGRNTIQYNKA